MGRSTQVVNNLGTFTATYNSGNLSGLPDSVSRPGGFSTQYSRYAANAGANALRLQTIHHKQGVSTVQKHDYAYDLTGNITTWDRTNAATDVISWGLRHDAANQLVELDESLNSVAQKKEAWHYDPAGNMASSMIVPAGLTGTMQIRSHTGRNQLTQVGGTGKTMVEGTTDEAATVTVNGGAAKVTKIGSSGPWRFEREMDFPSGTTNLALEATDGSSNVTSENYSVNVSSSAEKTLTYDANGNLTQVENGSSVVTRVCEWDAGNRLTAIQSAAVPAAGVKRSEFIYDGGGLRVRQIEKEHNGTTWITQSDWRYLWDGVELLQKRDASSGTVLANYFGGGEQQGSDALVYLPDHSGSIRSWYRVSDGAQGEAEFSAWGVRTVTSTGPGIPEHGYTGHFHHAASGLILAPFRAYDSELGRWISEDPIAEAGGINLYGYVSNNPAMLVDPTGEVAFVPFLVVLGVGMIVDWVYDEFIDPHVQDFINKHFDCDTQQLLSGIGKGIDIIRSAKNPLRLGIKALRKTANKGKPLKEWLKDDQGLLDEARSAHQSAPEWQGIDPDSTSVFYRSKSEVDAIRAKPGESGGHHPHGLALGGPEGQKLTPTGETRTIKNPRHSQATGLQRRIIKHIKKQL